MRKKQRGSHQGPALNFRCNLRVGPDARRPVSAEGVTVDEPREIRLTVGIDVKSQPIRGWIEGTERGRQIFIGMLELIALLADVQEAAPPAAQR